MSGSSEESFKCPLVQRRTSKVSGSSEESFKSVRWFIEFQKCSVVYRASKVSSSSEESFKSVR